MAHFDSDITFMDPNSHLMFKKSNYVFIIKYYLELDEKLLKNILCIACIYSTPPPQTGLDTRSIFKWRTAGLLDYLPMTGRRRDGLIIFPKALAQSEMQKALLRT